MPYRLSRFLHVLTAAYGTYAAVKPDHLPDALQVGPTGRDGYRLVAYTWTARDLPLSALGAFGPAAVVPVATALRICIDVGDAVVLARHTDQQDVRKKVLGVTLGWGALNTLAFLVDRRRAGRSVLG